MPSPNRHRLPPKWSDALALPVIAAPMFLVSTIELVSSACQNGVLGAIPTVNARTPQMLDEWLRKLTGELDAARRIGKPVAPWALNVITHSTNQRLPEDLELCLKHKPDVVITALGSPKPAIEAVHSYGGLIFADVNTPEYARKAALTGADGLVLVCTGAGGHTGQLAAPAFIEAVREFFDGIIVVGGAIGTGAAVRAMQTLGADLVYVGTRLIASEESNADPRYKKMVIECQSKDLVLTNAITGAWSYKLRPSLEAVGLDPDNLEGRSKFNMNYAEKQPKSWKDIWSAGQGVGTIRQAEPIADILTNIRKEYEEAIRAERQDYWSRRYAA
jgi:nitronate monooxygenase